MIDTVEILKLMKKDVEDLVERFKESPSLDLLLALQRKTIQAALWNDPTIDSWKISYNLTLYDQNKLPEDLRTAFNAVLDSIQFVRSNSTEAWVEQRNRKAEILAEDQEMIALLRVLRDKGPILAKKFQATVAFRGTVRLAYARAERRGMVRDITMTKQQEDFVGLTHEGRTLLRTLDVLGL